MKLSLIAKFTFSCILFFAMKTLAAQSDSLVIVEDSLDRYGTVGLRSGAFYNINKENRFMMPVTGVFINYSFGKYMHSIEIDFLTRRFKKFFRNAYSPCLTYGFAVKKQLKYKMELHTGGFVNCRKDIFTERQYISPFDTSAFKRGNHTVFSFGPSVEITRRIFFPGKNNFLNLGARITYSFDLFGFGSTYFPEEMIFEDFGPLAPKDRFQRDVMTFTLKIGWGKLVFPQQAKKEDPELRIMDY